jgi:hypothetical protein
MTRKTSPTRKTRSKPSRALAVVRKSKKQPAAPSVAEEVMRLVRETHANSVKTLELQREATALAREDADACKLPVIEHPKTTLEMVAAMKADTLSAAEAAYITHYSEQNIYKNIDHVGFELITGKFFSNAKLLEYWPERYDEARFWETVRRPINAERFAGILAMLPESQIM